MKETTDSNSYGVLYPCDYTIASLASLRLYLERCDRKAMRLFLVHGYLTPDSISDLLFYSPSSTARMLADPGFTDACAVLKNRFTFISSIACTVYSGRNQAAFENFIRGLDVREAVLVHGYTEKSHGFRSFDLTPHVRSSNLRITEIHAPEIKNVNGTYTLADLFPGNLSGFAGRS
jgi:hypothetical protein